MFPHISYLLIIYLCKINIRLTSPSWISSSNRFNFLCRLYLAWGEWRKHLMLIITHMIAINNSTYRWVLNDLHVSFSIFLFDNTSSSHLLSMITSFLKLDHLYIHLLIILIIQVKGPLNILEFIINYSHWRF
jgi:hypothetical protein